MGGYAATVTISISTAFLWGSLKVKMIMFYKIRCLNGELSCGMECNIRKTFLKMRNEVSFSTLVYKLIGA